MRTLLTIFLFVISINIFSQEYNDKIRAGHILDIPKYITWPNEKQITVYRIAVIDKDSSLFHELKLSEQKTILHNKPVKILLFNSPKNVSECEVIFLKKESGFDLKAVLSLIGTKTLLISENYDFHKSMINFIVVNGQRKFEMNEDLMKEYGFKVNPLFTALAVKTKADWESLYKVTEVLLDKEKEVVSKQNEEIKKQKEEIEDQGQRIHCQKEEIDVQQKRIDIQSKKLNNLLQEIEQKQSQIAEKSKVLEAQEQDMLLQKESISRQQKILDIQTSEIDKQQKQIEAQGKTLNSQLEQIEKQKIILYFFVVLTVLILAVVYFIYRAYRIKKKTNKLLKEKNTEILNKNYEITKQKEAIKLQNVEILQHKEEIEAQRDEIERQRDEILAQHDMVITQRDEILHQKQEITDSILYARRIQRAVLPPDEFLKKIMPDHFFILNKPRDIVSGDYYWIAAKENFVIFAVADCTGHGVPGAFMSMLGVAFLNEIVNKKGIVMANEILDELREQVMKSLHQSGKEGEAKDGMDIALCVLDLNSDGDKYNLQFAGANNPLYIVRKLKAERNKLIEANTLSTLNTFELYELKGDKMPIGIYVDEKKSFSNNSVELYKGDSVYIFSDGYADQFGGPKGKKFKYGQFKELLLRVQDKSMNEQSEILNLTIEEWQGELPQVDDICVLGVRM